MKTLLKLALATALVPAGVYLGAPAQGQTTKARQQNPQEKARRGKAPVAVTIETSSGRKLVIGPAAQAPFRALQLAITAKDNAAFATALPTAEAAVNTPDERFALGQLRLQQAIETGDQSAQLAALEAIGASGGATPADLGPLYRSIGDLAGKLGNQQKADEAFAKLVQLSPNDPDTLAASAQRKLQQKKNAEALPLLERAIAAQKAAGQPVPESWLRLAMQLANEARMGPRALELSREALAAYPTAVNWRNALALYRGSAQLDEEASLDMLRLMRISKALSTRGEILPFATRLSELGLPAEAKLVLEDAGRANIVPASDPAYAALLSAVTARIANQRSSLAGREQQAMAAPAGILAVKTADAYLGYADYAKAAALYRAAIKKGSIDANLANTRLGMALALAGNKAEAEAAFRAVTGARAGLASLWLQWLANSQTLGS